MTHRVVYNVDVVVVPFTERCLGYEGPSGAQRFGLQTVLNSGVFDASLAEVLVFFPVALMFGDETLSRIVVDGARPFGILD